MALTLGPPTWAEGSWATDAWADGTWDVITAPAAPTVVSAILSVTVADQFEVPAVEAFTGGEPPSALILSVTVADQFNNPAIVIPFAGMSKECAHTCPLGQFAQVTYDGGTEAGGPFIRSSLAASDVAFFGLLALYDPAQEVIALMHYDGESLDGPGTLIAAISQALVAADVLRIEADTTDPEIYYVKVNSVIVIGATIDSDDLPTTNPCIGFAVVGEPGTIEIPEPGEDEEAMIATQAADLSLTNDTLSDTELVLAMEANETYVGTVVLRYSCASATPDMKVTMVGPALCEGKWFDPNFNFEAYDLASTVTYSVSAGFDLSQLFAFTIRNGATVGDLKFQVAQAVTNATPLVVKQDSYMLMFKKV